MAGLVLNPNSVFRDNAGLILSNGTLEFFVNKTSNATTIFTTRDELTAQSNPYTLSANGTLTADVYFSGLRRMVVKNSAGATIRTQDDVAVIGSDESTAIPPISAFTSNIFTAEAFKSYTLDDSVSVSSIILPDSPATGTFIRFYRNLLSDVANATFKFFASGSDTILVAHNMPSSVTGTHDGGNTSSTLIDSTASFSTNSFQGYKIKNTTQVTESFVDSNIATVVTPLTSPAIFFNTGDSYSLDLTGYSIKSGVQWGYLLAQYNATKSEWVLSFFSATADGLLYNPQDNTYDFVDSGNTLTTVTDYLVALDAELFSQFDPSNTFFEFTGATFTVDNRFRNKVATFTGSSASTGTITSNTGLFQYQLRNNGTADITLTVGSGVTLLTLNNGERISTIGDITVPPGTQCTIVKDSASEAAIYTSFVTVAKAAVTEYTIASGIITLVDARSPAFIQIDTEADASSDTLDTINGGYVSQVLICQVVNSSRNVTYADATGNLVLAGNFTTIGTADIITFIRNASSWYEISRSTN